jgi:photosystem II stability/assembly factor-like uncharacterized protein
MKLKTSVLALFIAGSTYATFAQAPAQVVPRDDGYVSRHQPRDKPRGADNIPIKDDALGRFEWRREVMGGDLTPEFMESMMTAADAQRAQYGLDGRGAIQVPAGGKWTNIGPYRSNWIQNGLQVQESDTGRVRSFLVHPTNADILYVLTSSGGLWRTSNFSDPRPAWRPTTDAILSTSGGGAALGKNPETIYLGTGDPFDPGVGGYARRSTNGGETWSNAIKLGASTIVPDVKVDTTGAADVVLMGTNAGLFRSADGGDTYGAAPVLSGLIWSLTRTSAGWLAARTVGPTGSILVSTDRGATWTPIPNAGAVYAGAGRTTLAVGAPGDPIVYAFAATTGNASQKDLYRSTDGGLNWTAIGLGQYVVQKTPTGTVTVWVGKTPVNPNPDQPNMDIMAGQAFYNQMVLVDPNDASRNTVYLGGQLSSAKSLDGGNTWRIVSNWLAQFDLPYVHADFHAAAFTTLKGDPALVFGTDGGLFVSTDGARSFSSQKNDGISSYLIYALAGNPKHPDDVLIGLQDDGTRWREGKTGTYNQVLGGDGFGVAWSQATDRVGLASIYYSYIVRDVTNPPSTQHKWRVGWNGIAEFFNPALTYFNTALATPRASADAEGVTFFHRTRYRLYRTTDGAVSWTCVMETPLATNPVVGASPDCAPPPPPPPPPAPVPPPPTRVALRAGSHPIGISPEDLNHFGVLANGGWFYATADGGENWTSRNLTTTAAGWPGFNATLAYGSNMKLYVGNEAPIGTAARVLRSVDGGDTWSHASVGLPPVPTTKLIVSPRDPSGNTVYAGTWLGVYETTDGGASWHLYGAGLPVVVVSDLYMPTDGSYLRVSTYGRGVWETRF